MGRYPQINMSEIPVAGIGGIGMLVIAAVIAVVFPEARLVVVSGAVAGTVLALGWILRRRRRRAQTAVLFGDESGSR